jgi:cytochrome c
MRQSLLALILLATFPVPVAAAAEGDAANGETLVKRCTTCHTVNEGGANRIGPNLFGVFGSIAGARPTGFNYSAAIRESGVVWNEETLDQWLTRPRSLIADARMGFPGLSNADQRADVIAYLKTLK